MASDCCGGCSSWSGTGIRAAGWMRRECIVTAPLAQCGCAALRLGWWVGWYSDAMRATIDMAGRLVVPKPLRDELGITGGDELEIRVVDGRLEATIPSRVRLEEGEHGLRFAADTDARLTADDIRELMERGRR